MHNKHESIKTQVPQTRVIKFWSEGLMASTAYERIKSLMKSKEKANASSMMEEWLID